MSTAHRATTSSMLGKLPHVSGMDQFYHLRCMFVFVLLIFEIKAVFQIVSLKLILTAATTLSKAIILASRVWKAAVTACSDASCRLSRPNNAFFSCSPSALSLSSWRSSLSVFPLNMLIRDRMASRMSS